MKTDEQLQMDVQDELRWEPSVTATEIGVEVSDGVVTLSGTVPTYAEKFAAEKATRRVSGVKAVADEVTVKLCGPHKRTDTEIAEAAVRALRSHVWVPGGIQATVEDCWVTLRGEVGWAHSSGWTSGTKRRRPSRPGRRPSSPADSPSVRAAAAPATCT